MVWFSRYYEIVFQIHKDVVFECYDLKWNYFIVFSHQKEPVVDSHIPNTFYPYLYVRDCDSSEVYITSAFLLVVYYESEIPDFSSTKTILQNIYEKG